MLAIFYRLAFIAYCTIYSYNKLLNLHFRSFKKCLEHIVISCTLAIISTTLSTSNSSIRLLTLILLLIFFQLINSTNIHISILVSLISFSISYFSLFLASCIIGILFTTFNINLLLLQNPIMISIGGTIQLLFVILLFKIKRLNKGMPFLKYSKYINAGFIVCLCTIFLFIGSQAQDPFYHSTRLITLFLIFLLAIALLIWWRHKITQSYVEKLRVDEVELLYKEISDKDLEIEKLHAHNEQLSGIIHKDNKLIPAMEMAVRNYLQTAALMKPEDARQTGAELLGKLERMAEERTGIIHTYQENFSYRQRSGLISIDAIVDYMENRASTLGIEYHYQFDKTLKEMLPAFITEDDAMHLLSDLIENAIIAASHSEKKNIHIHIGFIRSILFIDISDSGIPFTPETYEKFGNIQYTTHAEHGGSGIGLMDIAKLKRQYQFSLQIYEYPENETIYTKKIRILFDRKAHYLIQSYRAKELRSAILRNDLHVIPYSDKEKP